MIGKIKITSSGYDPAIGRDTKDETLDDPVGCQNDRRPLAPHRIAFKAILVGQAPSVKTDGQPPFAGRSGRFLARLLDVQDVTDVFEPINLLDAWPGPARGKGDAFPIAAAKAKAEKLVPGFMLNHELVILAGRSVSRAFGYHLKPYLEPFDAGGFEIVIIPHPSGVVQWWNRKSNRRKAKRALIQAILRLNGHSTTK